MVLLLNLGNTNKPFRVEPSQEEYKTSVETPSSRISTIFESLLDMIIDDQKSH